MKIMEKKENIQGNLKNERLSGIIIALGFSKRTGTLVLKKDKIRKYVFFKEGAIVFAQSNDLSDRIDKVLLRVGLLNEQESEEVEKLFVRYGRITGKILVQNSLLTPQEFYASIRLQTLEIVCSLFDWAAGIFKFKEGELPHQGLPPVRMDSGVVVYEGLRRMTNWNIIHKDMSNFNQVFLLAKKVPTVFRNVKLLKSEKQMLEIVSTPRSIKDIIEDSQIDSYSAMKSLYLLHSMCFIEKVDEIRRECEREEFQIKAKDEAERDAVKKKCQEFLVQSRKSNYYEILAVKKDASESDIKKSYMKMIRDFHPDKYYHTPDKNFIQQLHSILLLLNRAYDVLKDKKKREEYNKELEFQARRAGAYDEPLARENFKKGLEELKMNELWRAAEFFKIATRLSPNNPVYWNHLSLALTKIPKKLKDAVDAALKTIELESGNSDHHVHLAHLYLKGGMKIRAKKTFEQALRLDPRNKNARLGLQELQTKDES
jgi:curved DNA-binding protein CbpA